MSLLLSRTLAGMKSCLLEDGLRDVSFHALKAAFPGD